MKTVMRIAESLVVMNRWTVKRLDIQQYEYSDNKISGFVGYLDVEIDDIIERIIIHSDGSFEFQD